MGLELVVRPVVFPSIRPAPPQIPVVVEEDDRVSEIIGRGGRAITLSHSRRWSSSRNNQRELSRTFDTVRVFNPQDEEQFVDIEVVKKLNVRNSNGDRQTLRLCDHAAGANTQIINTRQQRVC